MCGFVHVNSNIHVSGGLCEEGVGPGLLPDGRDHTTVWRGSKQRTVRENQGERRVAGSLAIPWSTPVHSQPYSCLSALQTRDMKGV